MVEYLSEQFITKGYGSYRCSEWFVAAISGGSMSVCTSSSFGSTKLIIRDSLALGGITALMRTLRFANF